MIPTLHLSNLSNDKLQLGVGALHQASKGGLPIYSPISLEPMQGMAQSYTTGPVEDWRGDHQYQSAQASVWRLLDVLKLISALNHSDPRQVCDFACWLRMYVSCYGACTSR